MDRKHAAPAALFGGMDLMEIAAEGGLSTACPRCRSEDYHRSRGLYEKIVLQAFGRTFYRCNQCGVWLYTNAGSSPGLDKATVSLLYGDRSV
jgi:hypothetical protein